MNRTARQRFGNGPRSARCLVAGAAAALVSQCGARPRRTGFARHVVIMAKEPVMGRVKTRLGKDIGQVRATYFFRHAARAVMIRLARDPRWQLVVSLSPDVAVHSRAWRGGALQRVSRVRQGYGDLGQRMQRIFDQTANGPVLIIGTDIPQIKPVNLAQAFWQLGKSDAVLGAAGDGGYWLVGQRRCPRNLKMFDKVRWSSAHTLDDTVANIAPCHVGYAATLGDVDEGADYERVRCWAGRLVLPITIA